MHVMACCVEADREYISGGARMPETNLTELSNFNSDFIFILKKIIKYIQIN